MAATGEFAQEANKTATEVVSQVGEGIAHAKDRVQEWTTEGAECIGYAVKTIAHDAADLIRKHPVPALLVAVGIGFCLSRAMRHWT